MRREKAFEVLVGRVMLTLPDSLEQRERVLAALAAWLPPNHRFAPLVREMRIHLEEHHNLQRLWAGEDGGEVSCATLGQNQLQ